MPSSPSELERLHAEGTVSKQVTVDYPDGIDLIFAEPDFVDFQKTYGWRPPVDPEAIRRAFLAVLSGTRRWRSFRGTGMIAARDLERRLTTVDKELRSRRLVPTKAPAVQRTDAKARRLKRGRELRARRTLERIQVRGINPGRELSRQKFSKILMETEGDTAEDVFSRLHEKRRK